MKIFNRNFLNHFALAFMLCAVIVSCSDKDGINGYAPTKPIGGYLSSSEISPGSLVAHWGFDGTLIDSVSNLSGTPTNTSFQAGRKGQALKGASNGFVEYPTPTAIADLESFTVALWINTNKHDGGAQSVFMLPKTSDFWGNMFLMIEGNNAAHDSMLVKFHFAGQWIELLNENRLPNAYGGWKHLAFTYSANTSKVSVYYNGVKRTLPASITDRKNGPDPLGAVNFVDVSKFIIGGFQQHLGAPWGAPDGWMLPYTGLLDEFRVYSTALTDSEVNSLYKLEALGR